MFNIYADAAEGCSKEGTLPNSRTSIHSRNPYYHRGQHFGFFDFHFIEQQEYKCNSVLGSLPDPPLLLGFSATNKYLKSLFVPFHPPQYHLPVGESTNHLFAYIQRSFIHESHGDIPWQKQHQPAAATRSMSRLLAYSTTHIIFTVLFIHEAIFDSNLQPQNGLKAWGAGHGGSCTHCAGPTDRIQRSTTPIQPVSRCICINKILRSCYRGSSLVQVGAAGFSELRVH